MSHATPSPRFLPHLLTFVLLALMVFLIAACGGTSSKFAANVSQPEAARSSVSVITRINVNASPFGIAVNDITNRIYVANGFSVQVIDGNTNTVIDDIKVPDRTAFFLAVNPHTNRIYASSCCGVSVIDGRSNTIIATVTLQPNAFLQSLPLPLIP